MSIVLVYSLATGQVHKVKLASADDRVYLFVVSVGISTTAELRLFLPLRRYGQLKDGMTARRRAICRGLPHDSMRVSHEEQIERVL